MFSDSFSEGQERDINEGFPSDSDPYAEHYEYLSDSDLEDGSSYSSGEDEEPLEGERDSQRVSEDVSDTEMSQTDVPDLPSLVEMSGAQNGHKSTRLPLNVPHSNETNHRLNNNLTRTGKVAIIRDMGAVTCVRYCLSQPILPPYLRVADLRQCYVSYTLAR